MTESSSKPREISLGDNFGDVAVKVNGATIEVHADGSVVAYTGGDVDAWTNASVRVHAATNDSAARIETAPGVGAIMPDGTVYAGSSPDTGKAMYATPADAPLTYTFNQARKYAEHLDAHGHKDWRVPTKGELNVLFNNRTAIGGFDGSDSNPAGWYWSSSQGYHGGAWTQRFSDGLQGDSLKDTDSSLRCVR